MQNDYVIRHARIHVTMEYMCIAVGSRASPGARHESVPANLWTMDSKFRLRNPSFKGTVLTFYGGAQTTYDPVHCRQAGLQRRKYIFISITQNFENFKR